MDDLFNTLRESCSSGIWSRAVELVRSDAIVLDSRTDDEIELRISPRGSVVNFQVILYPGDEDWSCDCGGKADPCEHVAAAAIAMRRGDQGDTRRAPTQETIAKLSYRFRRSPGGLRVQRWREVPEGEDVQLETTLHRAAETKSSYPRFTTTQLDLRIEQTLGPSSAGVLPRLVARKLFPLLKEAPLLQLDGAPITIGNTSCGLVGWIEDHPEGFWLQIGQDKTIEETFPNGVLRRSDTLIALQDVGLTAKDLQRYRQGVVIRPREVAEITNHVLPQLEAVMPVQRRTHKLPGRSRALPRLVIATSREGDALVLLPTLVYGNPPTARVDGERLIHLQGDVPIRNKRQEDALVRQLRETLGMTPGTRASFPRAEGVKAMELIHSWDSPAVLGDAHAAFRKAPALSPRCNPTSPLSLDFISGGLPPAPGAPKTSSGANASPRAVLEAWQQGESLVPLDHGGFAPLPRDWLEKNAGLLADLLAAHHDRAELPRASLADLAQLHEALDEPPPADFSQLRDKLRSFDTLPKAPLPPDLQDTLRDYQLHGVNWLHYLRDLQVGSLLADDMGLGKTLQTLCSLPKKSLVVCPTSVLPNWVAEIKRFRPELGVNIFHGPTRKLDESVDITLTTYAILRNEQERLGAILWAAVVLDEAQAIKNPDSQIARAAYTLRASHRIALTGTPIENRLEELWSQFHFINPGYLGGRANFQERYARPIREGDETMAAHLRKRIRPFILRRLKREVAPELPPRTDNELYCELNPTELAVYEALRVATQKELLEKLNAGGNVMAALEALLRLRQAACHSGLIPGAVAETSSKIELLLRTLEPLIAADSKALVFSQWTSFLDRMEPHLQESGIDFIRLDGATRDRGGVVERFQDPKGPRVMLVSLKAGGTGLNLTAADHVFIMDPWWNPAVEQQAADRAHRIGQEKPVFVHRIISKNTVEEKILALQQRKRDLADLTLSGAGQTSGITRDELLELLV